MNFTHSQQKAIDTRDCSLIISAGAGSGKTAVLTERILERICDVNDECNINDFLIVTFTRAAARELSDRIRKKLTERARLYPGNRKITRNIALMPLAKIMTINAFCYELVRENFQKTGLSSSVRIADEAEIAVIRTRLMNEVVDEWFEERGEDEGFLAAYEIFASSKNDKGFVDMLLSLDAHLSNIIDREGFCEKIIKSYEEISRCGEFFDTSFGIEVKEEIKALSEKTMASLGKLMEACLTEDILTEKYYPVIESEYEFARSVYHTCDKGYRELSTLVAEHKTATFAGKIIPKTFHAPELKQAISSGKKAAADSFNASLREICSCSDSMIKTAAGDTRMILEVVFEMTEDFRKRLMDKKHKASIIEFSDAERFSLSLLVKSFSPFEVTDFAKNLRNSYKEIYIDEYQDVNPLQDMIFKSISRHGEHGESNRFMVGDIKQSIYRFRGARSEIFMHYRDTFSDIDDGEGAKRIFMSDNFRCSRSVIGLTNLLFERLMGDFYREGDRLLFSRQEDVSVEEKVKLVAFEYDSDAADGISSPELEASLIASKIKQLVFNPSYVSCEGKMYKYSDIGILARNKASLKVYEKVLNACGIPSFCSFGESFYGKKEIMLCMNILSSVDNPERDIYLAGFMRSFAGGFSDDELAIIRKKYKDTSLYRAVLLFSEEQREAYSSLCEKCAVFIEKLRYYRDYSRGKGADKLLWKLYCDMDLINICTSEHFTNDKKGTRKNLLKLYQMARDFTKTSFRGVGAFIEYICGSMENSDVKAERELMGDCVSLMTIHASKGLEFPICFVSNLSRKFDRRDEQERLVFSESRGVAVKLCDTKAIKSVSSETALISIDTPFRRFVAHGIDREMLEEETRILYVAMTRARDRLIMTGAFPKKLPNFIQDAVACGFTGMSDGCSSYFSMLFSALYNESCMHKYYMRADMSMLSVSNEAEKYFDCEYLDCGQMLDIYNEVLSADSTQDCCDDGLIDTELLQKLEKEGGFSYRTSDLPAKITVSYLKKGLLDDMANENAVEDESREEISQSSEPVPLFISGEKAPGGAERGTAMHLFMQFADYDECEKSCAGEADRLYKMGFIDKLQRDILDIERLDEFFAGDFYAEIKRSRKIYREQRFNLDLTSFDTKLSGDILVQGVIDLFYENDDGTYTLVDFKTDRVFGEGAEQVLIERHAKQLEYYKRAVEEMTGAVVREVYIYSFSLMKGVVCLSM